MKIGSFINHLFAVIVIAMCASPAVFSADIPADLNANEIVRRMVQRNHERARDLQSFTGYRRYHLDYRGFPSQRSAELNVEMFYRAPGEKQFRTISESGSKLIIDRVFKKLLESERDAGDRVNQQRTALTPENYEFLLIGRGVIAGRNQYILSVTPRSENKYLYRGKIWVDADDFAVTQITAQPGRNPSFWTVHTEIQHVYVKIGEFWLPSRNTTVTKVRLGGTATLTIDYFNYKIGADSMTSRRY
jgi:outer membrane lipoprotein-sorting protein